MCVCESVEIIEEKAKIRFTIITDWVLQPTDVTLSTSAAKMLLIYIYIDIDIDIYAYIYIYICVEI